MALSLDDQLLGEKVDNYCSSDEGEQDSDEDRQQAKSEPKASNIPEPQLRDYNGFSTNVSDCFIYILLLHFNAFSRWLLSESMVDYSSHLYT